MTVYFIRDAGGDVKIGYSERDPFGRLATMQTGNPRALTLLATIPGDRSVERELHDKFSPLRVRGEWFRGTPELLGFVDGLLYAFRENQSGAPSKVTSYGVDFDQLDRIVGAVVGHLLYERTLELSDKRTVTEQDAAEAASLSAKVTNIIRSPEEDGISLGAQAYAPLSIAANMLAEIMERSHGS